MSGPKVVRIVTREERIAIGQRQLAELDRCIEAWQRAVAMAGVEVGATIAKTTAHRTKFQTLLADDKFMELGQQVASEVAYLKSETERLQEVAIQAAAERKANRLRLRENAVVLIKALKEKGRTENEPLLARLEAVRSGQGEVTDMEVCLSEALRALTPEKNEVMLTDVQRALAARLNEPGEVTTFDAWKAANAAPLDSRIDRIYRQLAELELAGLLPAAAVFSKRLEAVEEVVDMPTRNLRLDSLVLDLATAVCEAKAEMMLIEEARGLVAELSVREEAICQEMGTQLEAALGARDITALSDRLKAAKEALTAAHIAAAAEARRRVLLEGLAKLGYSVHEGMAGAWAEKGRIVLQKPSLPGYGVEIGGNTEGERLQVRAVAFSADRDTARDRDVETIWCGEFSKLQEDLAVIGGGLDIERALLVGSTPLKVVSMTEEKYEQRRVEHHQLNR
ncbi:hypothetical protein [Pseudogulbenkiania subflava]|uniref:Uncharacterized protein n=1 Tax=Pseudogulbenkiania subflava DSM 22618 TaxID=1123014 RepID=A0A1Y6BPB9_9NEIS|nr:hypothetical protein [Pseudogulbenkiania subflava]SMF22282.1 hypothetical protein SAMN02745746_01961 [Pseudogulbenkiania subflava DSM 22618]